MTKNETAAKKMTDQFGSYLIIPLTYEDDMSEMIERCEKEGLERSEIKTTDFNDIFKSMVNGSIKNPVGIHYAVPAEMIAQTKNLSQTWHFDGYDYRFAPSFLYIFHTNVAFLCLGILFNDISALETLCEPGKSSCDEKQMESADEKGETVSLCLNDRIKELCSRFRMKLFFDSSTPLLENYTYTIALTEDWFPEIDELNKKTFNIHQMLPINSAMEDQSEQDIRYVQGKKNSERNAYRWGACITSQTYSHIFARCPEVNHSTIESTMEEERSNTLPMIVFSLYERYTCLKFTRGLNQHLNDRKYLNKLKKSMLAFKAYGTFPSVDISRYYNIKQSYKWLSEVNDTEKSIDDVEVKLDLLMDRQQETAQKKNDRLSFFLTVFGAVSIIEASQSIAENLIGSIGEVFKNYPIAETLIDAATAVFWTSVGTAALLFILFLISRARK